MFSRLISLIKAYDTDMENKKPETDVKVGMSRSDIDKIKKAADTGTLPVQSLNALFKPRRICSIGRIE
jgi:hypothetical protein